jgi:hypothetical protein
MTLGQLRERRREFRWGDIVEELEPVNTCCPSTSGSSRPVQFIRSLSGVRSHHGNAERRQMLYERCELMRECIGAMETHTLCRYAENHSNEKGRARGCSGIRDEARNDNSPSSS